MKTSIRILNRPIEHKQHDPPRFSPLLLQIAVHSASNIDVSYERRKRGLETKIKVAY